MTNPATAHRLLVILLRLAGCVTVTAFLAILLPVEWMSVTHRWLGLGEFPRSPVVDYLARSAAGLYGMHGTLLLVMSRDPVRYRSLIKAVAVLNVIAGPLLVSIDLHAGMPIYWTLAEGPPIAGLGIVMLYLVRGLDVGRTELRSAGAGGP